MSPPNKTFDLETCSETEHGFPEWWLLLIKQTIFKTLSFKLSCLLATMHCRRVLNTICPGELCSLFSLHWGKHLMRTGILLCLGVLLLLCVLYMPRSTCVIKVVYCFTSIVWVWDTSSFHGQNVSVSSLLLSLPAEGEISMGSRRFSCCVNKDISKMNVVKWQEPSFSKQTHWCFIVSLWEK